MATPPDMCLSVALFAEAQPLIDDLCLERRLHRGLFPVYSAQGVALVVSGVGKLAASAAVAYLNTLLRESGNCGWLNVGLAGHPQRSRGEGLVASRITEAATGRSWMLTAGTVSHLECEPLITVDAPETKYAKPAMYDMEAAGFYATARMCTSKERIQCFKVISDNRANAPTTLTPTEARRLIGACLEDIHSLIQEMRRNLLRETDD